MHRQARVQSNNLPELQDDKVKLYVMSSYSHLPHQNIFTKTWSEDSSESAVAERAQLTSVWESADKSDTREIGKPENA